MRKVALSAAIAAAASLTYAADATPGSALPASSACAPGAGDTACTSHPLDANGDGTVSAAELAAFSASSASAPDLSPLRPPQHTGLDFKDAATEPAPPAPAPSDHNRPPPLILALLALAALLVLLRRRPG